MMQMLIKPKIIIAVLVILTAGYACYLSRRVNSLKQLLSIQTQINADNIQELKNIKELYKKNEKALEDNLRAVQDRNLKTSRILESIKNEKDAPVAPVLTVALDGLRNSSSKD